MLRKRTVIVGLDGVPYQLVRDLSQAGILPHIATLVKGGIFRQMASSIPEISSVAWSSLITGSNPGQHGIFGFTDLAPGTYRTVFPNYQSLRVEPFWERPASGRSVILNVPATYPAAPMNGVHVAGFVALDLAKATWPPSLLPLLKQWDYRVDVDTALVGKSLRLFLADLQRTFEARLTAYRYLWSAEDWQTFMLVLTGTDRLSHFLWDAYQDRTHPYHAAFIDYFRQIDAVIGEMLQSLRDDDVFVLLSDHGFEKLEKDVQINHVLQENGFLKFTVGANLVFVHVRMPPAQLRDMAEESTAFALDPARIYLHVKGRFPRGAVQPGDVEPLLRSLTALFAALEIEGQKVIKRVYRKEEIYHGPFLDQAPDLVLLPNPGFNLRANIKARELWSRGEPGVRPQRSGKHSQDNAFLLVGGNVGRGEPGVRPVPETPSVSDVVGILDQLCDIPSA